MRRLFILFHIVVVMTCSVVLAQEAATPALEFTLDRISDINTTSKSSGISAQPVGYCKECLEQNRNMNYQQCSAKNSYLEEPLDRLAVQNSFYANLISRPISYNPIIKPSCIRMGMEANFGKSSTSFRQCTGDQRRAQRRAVRPCITEKYFHLVANSFDIVGKCLASYLNPQAPTSAQMLDVRAVYALINVESGFHVNAFSGTGAGGIGQFTQSAIEAVNRNSYSAVRSHLAKSDNGLCRSLNQGVLAEPMAASATRSCERISIQKGNPVKNMVYTFAYLAGVKKELEDTIFSNPKYAKRFKLSSDDLEKVKRALMIWSHNTGPAGTWTPAKSLLRTKYANSPVTNADAFIKEMQMAMQKFPASANESHGRRGETSRYFPAITSTLRNIESGMGGQSCLNN